MYDSTSDTTSNMILWGMAAIIALAIVFIIMRWIFAINEFLKLQHMQTKLLIKIAEKQGVSQDDIDGIINSGGK